MNAPLYYSRISLYLFRVNALSSRPSMTYPVDPSALRQPSSLLLCSSFPRGKVATRAKNHPYARNKLAQAQVFFIPHQPENLRAARPSTIFKRHMRCYIGASLQFFPADSQGIFQCTPLKDEFMYRNSHRDRFQTQYIVALINIITYNLYRTSPLGF